MRPAEADARALTRERRTLAAILIVALVLGTAWAARWVWRDITYWSRSVTFPHGSQPLEACLSRALPALSGVSIRAEGGEFRLEVPGQEGALVKPTPDAGIARIVVFGHSASVSTLGPPVEESVDGTLQALKSAFSSSCASP